MERRRNPAGSILAMILGSRDRVVAQANGLMDCQFEARVLIRFRNHRKVEWVREALQ